MEFFVAVHIAAFAIGAAFAWLAHARGLPPLAWACSLFALAELSYLTYHLDWTVFLLAHTISEVLDLATFVLVFAAAVARGGSDPLGCEPVATTHVALPKSYRFEPAVIEVPAGATVTRENEDNFTHTVRFDGEDETAELETGESFTRPFPEQGAFHYLCTLHPRDMEGEVRVGQ